MIFLRVFPTGYFATHPSLPLAMGEDSVSGSDQSTTGIDRIVSPPPTTLGSRYGNLAPA